MTYKEKMKTEHPTVDSNFMLFSCPGNYFDRAPHCNNSTCPGGNGGVKCADCWNTEIPEAKPEITDSTELEAKQIATRVKKLYNAFRNEGLNHQEAFDLVKIIISGEIGARCKCHE